MLLQPIQRTDQRQTFVVNAQLQQAICLLQMNNSELQSYIEREAQENPFLDVDHAGKHKEQNADRAYEPRSTVSRAASDDFDYIGALAAAPAPSLYGHVSAQFDIMFVDVKERMIAECFLEALEPTGWLGEPLERIAARAGISQADAEHMLARIQQVEPAGLFARSLTECLALQARERGAETPTFSAVLENLSKLAAADMKGLLRACKCSMEDLREELKLLRCLNPKPGADFETSELVQRVPDVIVTKGDDGWVIDLNKSTLPSVVIDEKHASVVAKSVKDSEYVGERLSVARWLRRAVAHRNETTLKIGAEIARRQTAFLEKGPAYIRPMILRDVAEKVGVHESTVSRVTSGLMMATPQGTFPMKTFFSTALSGAGEGAEDASAAAIRHRIQQLVKEEDPLNPLSDDALAKIISDEGTHLARRTVAKYRDILKIASSFQRRRNAKLML